jgi:hypothetical protein
VRFEKAPFAFGSRTAQQGEKSYLAGFMEVPVLVGEK